MDDNFDTTIAIIIMLLFLGCVGGCLYKIEITRAGGYGQGCNRDGSCDYPNLYCDPDEHKCLFTLGEAR